MGCSGSKEKQPKNKKDDKKDDAAVAPAPVPASSTPAQPASTPAQAAANGEIPAPRDDTTTLNSDAKEQQIEESKAKRAVDAPAGRATNANDDNIGNSADVASSTVAPRRPAKSGDVASVDENGNAIVLPKGDWVHTEGTPYYYSATENLYYHPPSCQFYDPTNEMWYDPEKDEWYRDDEDDEAAE